MEDSTENSIFKNKFIDGSILIAIFSLLSYSFGYTFKLGYCYYFGIPVEFIGITFKDILGAATFIFVLLISFFIYYKIFAYIFKKIFKIKLDNTANHYTVLTVLGFILIFIFYCIFLILFKTCRLFDFNLVISCAIIIFSILTLVASYMLDSKHYVGIKRVFFLLFLSLMCVIAVWALIFIFSYNYALKQTSFSYIDTNKADSKDGYIILVNNDRGYVCTQIDKDSNNTFPKFFLIDYSTISEKNYSIREEYIGNIKFSGENHLFHKGIFW